MTFDMNEQKKSARRSEQMKPTGGPWSESVTKRPDLVRFETGPACGARLFDLRGSSGSSHAPVADRAHLFPIGDRRRHCGCGLVHQETLALGCEVISMHLEDLDMDAMRVKADLWDLKAVVG